MRKAVLTIDMPDTCGKCYLCQGVAMDGDYVCSVPNEYGNERGYDDGKYGKPDWCPLRLVEDDEDNIERWIEIDDGAYPDGFPKSKYKHESCGAVTSSYNHYCPSCGKRVNRIKILRYGFEEMTTKFLEEHGYIVE